MKKTSKVILLIGLYLVVFFLQANVFQNFTIAGIMPNLFVLYILFIGLFANVTMSVLFGVIGGLIVDLAYSKTIGVTALMMCVIGYLGAYFDRNFSKENKITIILMVAISTIIFETGYYGINSVILGFDTEMLYFAKILAIEVLYNVLLTILLYPFIQKVGYGIDRTFKKTNILTRYF